MLLIRITGDVIGVGFRATTRVFAKELNLIGYVRNMPDNSVEIGLDATPDQANTLIDKLKNAGFTRIDSTTIEEIDKSINASDFEIR